MYRIKKNEKKLKWIKYLSLLFGCFEMKIIKWKVIWFKSWKETKFKMNTLITLLLCCLKIKIKIKTIKLDSLIKTSYTTVYAKVRFKLYLM